MSGLGTRPIRKPQGLTGSQNQQIQHILSKYDPENLTAEDARSIFKSFRGADIPFGPGLKEAINGAGFDAQLLVEMDRPDETFQVNPDASGQNHIPSSALQSLQSILGQYDLDSLSPEDKDNLISQLKQTGLMKKGNLVDLGA
jgi:hypothetical protein